MFTSANLPTIPEWYRGRTIFITGGSGFMGKVLLEKLLRSCPDLDTIYLLLRPKKGKEPAARVKDLTDVPLFDKLKQANPSSLSKLVAVNGDITQVGLGLSDADRQLLQRDVSVVFHTAASVRFDEPIRDAILINVRGTREVLKLALGMNKLKVFQHLSTAFSNFNRADAEVILEKIYSPVGDWRTMIQLAENEENDQLLRMLTPKILGSAPNTYTYAKALAEQLVNDYRDKLPLVIVRPSVVISTEEEPIPGWIDNFNGPIGIWVAGMIGVIRVVFFDGKIESDFVPVDKAIKSMIYIAWHRGLTRESGESPPLPLYNCTTLIAKKDHATISDMGTLVAKEYPTTHQYWYPTYPTKYHASFARYYVWFLLVQFAPALCFDLLLRVKGKKPMFTKLQRRIFVTNTTIAIFGQKANNFSNAELLALETVMRPEDRAAFGYSPIGVFGVERSKDIILGARQYLLKDPLSTLPQARIKLKRMYWLDWALKIVLMLSFLWAISACSRTRSLLIYAQSMTS